MCGLFWHTLKSQFFLDYELFLFLQTKNERKNSGKKEGGKTTKALPTTIYFEFCEKKSKT
jgi:hypothetical protein